MVELLPRVCNALSYILTTIFLSWRKELKKAACFGTIRNYAQILRHKIAPEMLGMELGRVQGSIASTQEFLHLQPLGRKRRGIWIKGRITRGRDKAIHSFCIWFHLN